VKKLPFGSTATSTFSIFQGLYPAVRKTISALVADRKIGKIR
jgi:hypothetical protein